MQIEKSKLIIGLICCSLGASIVVFMLNRDGNFTVEEKTAEQTQNHEHNEALAQQQTERQYPEALRLLGVESDTQSDTYEDLEALSGDLLEGDIGDAMDMEWSSREITCDFSDYNSVAEVVRQFPVVGDVAISPEQVELLRNCATKTVFNNGNSDYGEYLSFLRDAGETVDPAMYEFSRKRLIDRGIPEEEIPTDPWELLSKDFGIVDYRSLWKGLVSEGSQIETFESQVSRPPLGRRLHALRGATTTFRHKTNPPISLDEVLEKEGKVIMADVHVLIAHDDSTGGVVWPYIIRYWFDPIHNSWRAQRAALFQNRTKAYRIYVLP